MNELNREQIKSWMDDAESVLESPLNHDEAAAARAILALGRTALASLEAEPVGEFYHEKQGGWYQISEGDKVPDNRRIPLFTATPAPVVKLPNEFISSEGIVVQIEKVMAALAVAGIKYERKGDACRNAMLQGKAEQPQNAQQNIPENIPDSCLWRWNDDDYYWSGSCGTTWCFTDGGPAENEVKYCHKCGKPVTLPEAPKEESE